MLGIMAVMDQKDFHTLVVGPGSGMCKMVFLVCVLMPLALFFDWFSGPECSALRPVWTRRTVVQVGIGSCAILGWNIETSWVTFARWLVLSMLRVSVCGLPCQWLVRFSWGEYSGSWVTFAWRMALSMVRDSVRGLPCQIVSCASLGENIVAVGLRSLGVLRSHR